MQSFNPAPLRRRCLIHTSSKKYFRRRAQKKSRAKKLEIRPIRPIPNVHAHTIGIVFASSKPIGIDYCFDDVWIKRLRLNVAQLNDWIYWWTMEFIQFNFFNRAPMKEGRMSMSVRARTGPALLMETCHCAIYSHNRFQLTIPYYVALFLSSEFISGNL